MPRSDIILLLFASLALLLFPQATCLTRGLGVFSTTSWPVSQEPSSFAGFSSLLKPDSIDLKVFPSKPSRNMQSYNVPPRKSYLHQLNPWSGPNPKASFWISLVRSFTYLSYPAVFLHLTSLADLIGSLDHRCLRYLHRHRCPLHLVFLPDSHHRTSLQLVGSQLRPRHCRRCSWRNPCPSYWTCLGSIRCETHSQKQRCS